MRMTTKTTDVPRPHADIRTAVRPSMKVGLAICGLLAIFDLAGLTGIGSEDAPSSAVLIPGGALGLFTLVAMPAVWRGSSAAMTAVVVSRVLAALGGVAAFSVDDAPEWAAPVVALALVVTAVAVASSFPGVATPEREGRAAPGG